MSRFEGCSGKPQGGPIRQRPTLQRAKQPKKSGEWSERSANRGFGLQILQ